MKKLLSLLSVLTISGTAVPTTIAASPYQKQETIKNSDINYQQTINLENLNRFKRDEKDNNKLQLTSKIVRNKSFSSQSRSYEVGLRLNLIIAKPKASFSSGSIKSSETEIQKKWELKIN